MTSEKNNAIEMTSIHIITDSSYSESSAEIQPSPALPLLVPVCGSVANDQEPSTSSMDVCITIQHGKHGSIRANASCVSVASCSKSETSLSTVGPACRICDYQGDSSNRLISPCRCSGSLKYVHEQCLNKWLQTINSQNSPRCEVCRYHIHTRKQYNFHNWDFPQISSRDKILHAIFLVNFVILVTCAVINIFGFVTDHQRRRQRSTLTNEEILTLTSGMLFFVSFIVALSTQIKVQENIYKLFLSFIAINTEWKIDDYKRSNDSLFANKR